MFLSPDPQDDEDTPFTAYDLKWVIIYAAIACAMTIGITMPRLT